MLQKISMINYSRGISVRAYTDGYSHDESGFICLVSILGPDSSVKGLSSGIVTSRDVTIETNDDYGIELCAMPGEKYRILSARLNSGLLHQIITMESLLNRADTKLIYVGDKEDPGQAIFSMIRRNFGTPLLPAWKNFLVRQIQKEGMAEVMEGTVRVAKIDLDEHRLDEIVGNGIRNRSIGF